jgi:hypothetical protein
MQDNYEIYDYSKAGFDGFLNRSIDNNQNSMSTLGFLPAISTGQQVNYDQMQVTGSLGDHLQIGNITLDGSNGRISIFDAENNEIVRLGTL